MEGCRESDGCAARVTFAVVSLSGHRAAALTEKRGLPMNLAHRIHTSRTPTARGLTTTSDSDEGCDYSMSADILATAVRAADFTLGSCSR